MTPNNSTTSLPPHSPSGPQTPPPPRRHVWMTAALCSAILVCGIAIGVGGTVLWLRARPRQGAAGPAQTAQSVAAAIQAKQGLTPEQTRRVTEAFTGFLQRLAALRQAARVGVEAEQESLFRDMRDVLTPEQYERWHRSFLAVRQRALKGTLLEHGVGKQPQQQTAPEAPSDRSDSVKPEGAGGE